MSSELKFYKVKLSAGFPSNRRQRAGFELAKGGEPLITALTAEELEKLNADDWITVTELSKEEIEARGETAKSATDDETDEVDLSKLKRPQLEKLATEMEIEGSEDKDVFPNVESLRTAITNRSEEIEKEGSEDTTVDPAITE